MNEVDFAKLSRLVRSRYGIDLTGKLDLMSARMDQYLRAHDVTNISTYLDALQIRENYQELDEFLDLITTNHTFFMRDFQQMDYFQNRILPELKHSKKDIRDLRIWCAAASSGEEAYMIAMILADFFTLEENDWNKTILATDISPKVLEKAMLGRYSAKAVDVVPQKWKLRYFRKINEEEYEMRDEVKENIIFSQFNLMDDFPFQAPMDVIFMRNVMIYFDEEIKAQLLRKVYNCLAPGGYLIIGSAETLRREDLRLNVVSPSVYEKPKEGE